MDRPLPTQTDEKWRLDKLLVEKGFVETRSHAGALILAGKVLVNDVCVDKAGARVQYNSEIRLRGVDSRFVSRGGDKIDPIFDYFQLNLDDVVAVDIGASTGGFTDSMLQRGAKRVFAVDVGYNQLHHRLRTDQRVVAMEKVNAKELRAEDFVPLPSVATVDVSFIGLRKVLLPVVKILSPPFVIVALVKPQFELEPEYVSKGGVVREVEHQMNAVDRVKEYASDLGLVAVGHCQSPLKGAKKGNQEFFVCLKSSDSLA